MNELVREVKTAFSFPPVFAAIGITAIVCFLLGNWYGDRNGHECHPKSACYERIKAEMSPERIPVIRKKQMRKRLCREDRLRLEVQPGCHNED